MMARELVDENLAHNEKDEIAQSHYSLWTQLLVQAFHRPGK